MTQPDQPAVRTTEITETTATVAQEPTTTDVPVEMPAKVVHETTVASAPETAGDAVPDAATQAMEAEPKE